MRRFVSIALLTWVVSASTLHAADRGRIRTLNVALQPAFTALSAALQGHLRTGADWFRCLTSGTAAGYAFYDAKARAGRGSVTPAWIEANAGASLTMNAAAGRNPFGRYRITLGPVRADVTTPFEKQPNAAVHFSSSLAEIGSLAMMQQHRNGHLVFRDGRFAFRTTKCYPQGIYCFPGYTIGSFSGTMYGVPDPWPHESVHAIQAVQSDAIEPPACAYVRRCADLPAEWKPVRFDGFDLGALLAVGGYIVSRQPYENRWLEIEAWRLANGGPPQP